MAGIRVHLLNILGMIEAAAEMSCLLAVSAMTGLVLVQVVLRYVFNAPLNWTEEASIFLMIWMTFVGAGVALRRGGHIAMTLLAEHLPAWLSRYFLSISRLVTFAFLFLVAWQGWLLAQTGKSVLSPALGIPMRWPYMIVPLGACFMATQLLGAMLDPAPPETSPTDTFE
jgi:TRAP-type transport system small permease protein